MDKKLPMPDFDRPSDPIERWFDRGKAKGARTRAALYDAQKGEAVAWQELIERKLEVAKTLVQVQDLDNILQCEFERGRMERAHDLAMLQVRNNTELESAVHELMKIRALSAPPAPAMLPPPPTPPPSAPSPAATPPPPSPPLPPQPAQLALEDAVRGLTVIPDLKPEMRVTIERILSGMAEEAKQRGR